MSSIARQLSTGAPTVSSSSHHMRRPRRASQAPCSVPSLQTSTFLLFVCWALYLYRTSIGLAGTDVWGAKDETRLLEGNPLIQSSPTNRPMTTAEIAEAAMRATPETFDYYETRGPDFGVPTFCELHPEKEVCKNPKKKPKGAAAADQPKIDPNDPDSACPFRRSPLYRSVYVYPTPDFARLGKNLTGASLAASNPIYSPNAGRSNAEKGGRLAPYPWLEWDNRTRTAGGGPGEMAQYTTELVVHDIMTHPQSCLSTPNPEEAKLFYVPYLPTMEFHKGSAHVKDFSMSPYAQAISGAIEGEYGKWEDLFGFTSRYWKKNNGADHILVYSEPLHGLSHPKGKRGSHHYIHTQQQLRPPIAVVVEMSTTFVREYPKCAAKNILVPYPNPDGRWYNGKMDEEAAEYMHKYGLRADAVTVLGTAGDRDAMLPAEREVVVDRRVMKGEVVTGMDLVEIGPRPITYYYNADNEGSCSELRRAMQADYKCTRSYRALTSSKWTGYKLPSDDVGMRTATFCPLPGGESPSAKSIFDAVLAGCIPVVMSYDFVWPFSTEYDSSGSSSSVLDPKDFSVRLGNAMDYADREYTVHRGACSRNSTLKGRSLQGVFESLDRAEIQRLRQGMKRAAELYSFYSPGPGMPNNTLAAGVLPDGGAAHALVDALAARVGGRRWAACEKEVKKPHGPEPESFKC